MTVMRVLIFAASLLAFGSVSAQTDQPASRNTAIVNKCIGANGSVIFSDKPCPDTAKAQKVDTSAALRTGSGGHVGEIAASVDESDCRRAARQTAYGAVDGQIEESNRHIADYQQRRTEYAAQKVYAPDGSGRMIDDPAAAGLIADIDAAIAKERSFQQQAQANAASKFETETKKCDEAAAKKAQPSP